MCPELSGPKVNVIVNTGREKITKSTVTFRVTLNAPKTPVAWVRVRVRVRVIVYMNINQKFQKLMGMVSLDRP